MNREELGRLAGPCRKCSEQNLSVVGTPRYDSRTACAEVRFGCPACKDITVYEVAAQLLAQLELEPESIDEELPIINGSVIGYRAWRIVDDQLYGVFANRPWFPGVNEATCDANYRQPCLAFSHAAPAVNCHCGITALARFRDLWMPISPSNPQICGAIEAWSDEGGSSAGRFILHSNGFRAQYGKIVLLAIDEDWHKSKKDEVRAIAREYQVDVCSSTYLGDAAKEHGQLVPSTLLKWVARTEPPMQGVEFIVPTWFMSSFMSFPQPVSINVSPHTKASDHSTRKGIKHTVGYNGPPAFGKYKRGDRVKDRSGAVWECTRGGNPGSWQLEG